MTTIDDRLAEDDAYGRAQPRMRLESAPQPNDDWETRQLKEILRHRLASASADTVIAEVSELIRGVADSGRWTVQQSRCSTDNELGPHVYRRALSRERAEALVKELTELDRVTGAQDRATLRRRGLVWIGPWKAVEEG